MFIWIIEVPVAIVGLLLIVFAKSMAATALAAGMLMVGIARQQS